MDCGGGLLYMQEPHTKAEKFRAYRSPVNRVYDADFQNAIENLLAQYEHDPGCFRQADPSSLDSLAEKTVPANQAYLKALLAQIHLWPPNRLEQMIEELFLKNGYMKTADNRHDKQGGDIDLVFDCFVPRTFMADIYALSPNTPMPEIRIQAKNKKGSDSGDTWGVEQLLKMEGHESAINILINTTPGFNGAAKEKAAEKGVILINGMEFAALLIKYGLDSMDDAIF